MLQATPTRRILRLSTIAPAWHASDDGGQRWFAWGATAAVTGRIPGMRTLYMMTALLASLGLLPGCGGAPVEGTAAEDIGGTVGTSADDRGNLTPDAGGVVNEADLFLQMFSEAHGLFDSGRYGAAAAKAREALRFAESVGSSGGMAEALHLLGRVHHEKGEYRRALDRYDTELEVRRSVNGEDRTHEARALWAMGAAWSALGEHGEALTCLYGTLAIYRTRSGDGRLSAARALDNVGALF